MKIILMKTIFFVVSMLVLINCTGNKPKKQISTPNVVALSTKEIISKINALEVFFSFDKANLSNQNRENLKNLNELLLLENASNISLTIEGHTDAIGTISYNLALGEERSQAVLNYLTQLGINQAKLDAFSYGEEDLKIDIDGREPLNRRVSFKSYSK